MRPPFVNDIRRDGIRNPWYRSGAVEPGRAPWGLYRPNQSGSYLAGFSQCRPRSRAGTGNEYRTRSMPAKGKPAPNAERRCLKRASARNGPEVFQRSAKRRSADSDEH